MAITARGVIARIPGAPAEVEEFTIDDPGPNEVLVRILASGVCHTDLGVKSGIYGTTASPSCSATRAPGSIEAVGPGVETPAGRRPRHPGLARAVRQVPLLPRGQPNFCAASLNAEKRMRAQDGQLLNPVLGIGTFCTHTLVHADQAVPDRPGRCRPRRCR